MHNRVAKRYLEAWRAGPIPRELRLPKDVRDTAPVNPEGTDLSLWTYEADGNFYAVVFAGKSQKPLWHYHFSSPKDRQRYLDETIQKRKTHFDQKQQVRDERKAWEHGIQVGDLFYSSWGYDQTNVDFYQATAVSGKAIVLREVENKVISHSSGSEKVVAVPNKFIGDAMKKIPSMGHDNEPLIRLNSFSSARKWDGKPQYQTDAYSGH